MEGAYSYPDASHSRNAFGQRCACSGTTGSGKTAAFVIPVLSKIGGFQEGTNAAKKNNGKFELKKGVRALLLAPTRELANRSTERQRDYVQEEVEGMFFEKEDCKCCSYASREIRVQLI